MSISSNHEVPVHAIQVSDVRSANALFVPGQTGAADLLARRPSHRGSASALRARGVRLLWPMMSALCAARKRGATAVA